MTSAKFWDGIAEKYAKMAVRNPENYHRSLDRTRTYLRPQDRVLELGCGTGSTALLLAPSVAHYTASDISSGMIGIANRKLEEAQQSNLTFVIADADDPSLGSDYDAILAFNLLHLLDDLPASLRHLHGMIREDGLLISKTPCLKSKKWLLGPVVWIMQKLGKAPDVGFVSPREVEEALKDAGFEVLEAADYGSRYIVAKKA